MSPEEQVWVMSVSPKNIRGDSSQCTLVLLPEEISQTFCVRICKILLPHKQEPQQYSPGHFSSVDYLSTVFLPEALNLPCCRAEWSKISCFWIRCIGYYNISIDNFFKIKYGFLGNFRFPIASVREIKICIK